ncbi:unnamed protein product [Pseudo-nitzschia multistriata]|uniref:Uncharacterized protein n=1 Tax=Pseudo-nitzschia multistriata TaxID=183589 RepID=A0A448Z0H7_9STRA|nr:unnamed protein product [Pseudo-nitzschia multistriata]
MSPLSESRQKGSRYHKVDDDYDNDCSMEYAQKLNNNAAWCIEIGYYERAIQSLQEALKYSQKQSDERLVQICRCNECILDGGIDFSADFGRIGQSRGPKVATRGTQGCDNDESSDEEDDHARNSCDFDEEHIANLTKSISQPKIQKVARGNRSNGFGSGTNASWSIKDEYCDEVLHKHKVQEIYKRPIRVFREGHSMGSTLFLVLSFNLALAHHLEAASSYSHSRHPKSAKKALLFYELAWTDEQRILADPDNCWDSLSSVRFNTILNNNLRQILPILSEKYLTVADLLLSNVSDSIHIGTKRLGNRKPSEMSTTRKSSTRRSGTSSREGGKGSGSLRSKKSTPTSAKNKLQLALGDMSPLTPEKGKVKISIGGMPLTSNSSNTSGSHKISRGRSGSRNY